MLGEMNERTAKTRAAFEKTKKDLAESQEQIRLQQQESTRKHTAAQARLEKQRQQIEERNRQWEQERLEQARIDAVRADEVADILAPVTFPDLTTIDPSTVNSDSDVTKLDAHLRSNILVILQKGTSDKARIQCEKVKTYLEQSDVLFLKVSEHNLRRVLGRKQRTVEQTAKTRISPPSSSLPSLQENSEQANLGEDLTSSDTSSNKASDKAQFRK